MVELPPSMGARPGIEDVAAHLGLSVADIDAAFGIVPLDPGRRLFAARLSRRPDGATAGSLTFYADPPVGPLAPPEGAD